MIDQIRTFSRQIISGNLNYALGLNPCAQYTILLHGKIPPELNKNDRDKAALQDLI